MFSSNISRRTVKCRYRCDIELPTPHDGDWKRRVWWGKGRRSTADDRRCTDDGDEGWWGRTTKTRMKKDEGDRGGWDDGEHQKGPTRKYHWNWWWWDEKRVGEKCGIRKLNGIMGDQLTSRTKVKQFNSHTVPTIQHYVIQYTVRQKCNQFQTLIIWFWESTVRNLLWTVVELTYTWFPIPGQNLSDSNIVNIAFLCGD